MAKVNKIDLPGTNICNKTQQKSKICMTSYHQGSVYEVPAGHSNVKNIIKTINFYANVCFICFIVIILIIELGHY